MPAGEPSAQRPLSQSADLSIDSVKAYRVYNIQKIQTKADENGTRYKDGKKDDLYTEQ